MLWGACVFFLALLIGCTPETTDNNLGNSDLEGRILLWHSWSEEDALILDEVIDVFEQLHPAVTVITVRVDARELQTRYGDTAVLGLGPDLLIGPSDWLLPLANETLIDNIEPELTADESFDVARYVPSAFALVSYAEGIYGLPLNLQTPALYYNRRLLGESEPADTFEGLLAQASEGQRVALSTRSEIAFMGVQAFGSPFLAEVDNELRVGATQDGFISWLQWLQMAQEAPGIILSTDEERLTTLFLQEQVTYYIASYDQLEMFQNALNADGEQIVGATPLPSGPLGQARPLIGADILMFNTASSDSQRVVAIELAKFLTNSEQNNTFMRELGRLPANQRVRVNGGVYPLVAAFVQQGRTAVELPASLRDLIISDAGDAVYTAVLSGALTPEESICDFIQVVRQQLRSGEPDFGSCQFLDDELEETS